jgi:phage protein D
MTAAGFDTAIIPAIPSIFIDGQVDSSFGAGLINLEVTSTLEGLSSCEVNVGNWGNASGSTGFIYFDRQALDFGKSFQVKFGPAGSEGTIFEGKISALEAQFPNGAQPYLTVLAEDSFQKLRLTRRTRTFENSSDSDVMNQLASDHGLTPDIQVSGPTHRVLAQVNQSDLAFLRERARTLDAELWIEGSTLHVASRSRRSGSASGDLSFGYPGTLREFSVLADLANQRTGLSVTGWDVSSKQAISYQAGDSLLQGELDNGTSGASILQTVFGDHKESVVHTVPQSSAEAQSTAETLFKRMARQFVTGRGVVDPDPRLLVGSTVNLSGLGPLFNGRYYVAGVRHLFDRRSGLRSEIMVERPGLGQP